MAENGQMSESERKVLKTAFPGTLPTTAILTFCPQKRVWNKNKINTGKNKDADACHDAHKKPFGTI